jgi:curved DNA-binding protein
LTSLWHLTILADSGVVSELQGAAMEYRDYYKILGVSKTDDEKEIKKTYRRLARKLHPDVNPGDPKAEARFKEINEAYEVLGDPEKRRKYDELGQNYQSWQQTGGQPGGFDWSQWTAGQPQGGQTRVQYGTAEDLFGGSSPFSDFFQSIFGGAPGGAGQSQRRSPSRAQDVEHEVEITLEEAFRGSQRLIDMDGRRVEVKIPAGVKTGSRVRVPAQAFAGGRNGGAGDLYLRLTVKSHPVFERRGDDLFVDVAADMFALLLGGEVRVPVLGGQLALKVPAGTQSGKSFRLAGQGMPKLRSPEQHGDLYARLVVRLPEQLSEKEKQLLQQWAELRAA